MAVTGVERDDVAAAATSPEFLGAVLDFVLTDDRWVVACAAALDVAPETLAQARAALPGGETPHWT